MHLLLYHYTEMYLYSWSRSDRRLPGERFSAAQHVRRRASDTIRYF